LNTLSYCVGLNVTTTTKSQLFWGKSALPEKILATRTRKWPRLTLVCPPNG